MGSNFSEGIIPKVVSCNSSLQSTRTTCGTNSEDDYFKCMQNIHNKDSSLNKLASYLPHSQFLPEIDASSFQIAQVILDAIKNIFNSPGKGSGVDVFPTQVLYKTITIAIYLYDGFFGCALYICICFTCIIAAFHEPYGSLLGRNESP